LELKAENRDYIKFKQSPDARYLLIRDSQNQALDFLKDPNKLFQWFETATQII